MDIIFARLALAALAGIEPVYKIEKEDSSGASKPKRIFPSYMLTLTVSCTKDSAAMFRMLMQSPDYSRKLIYDLQHMVKGQKASKIVERLLSENTVVTVTAVYPTSPEKPRSKAVTSRTVYRNGIYEPEHPFSTMHHNVDQLMFNKFLTNYLNGEYDGLFIK